MPSTVKARLDKPTQKALEQLVRRLAWTRSHILREGVRLLAECYLPKKRRAIIGLGQFSSGIGDLASNKRHMRGFGK